MTHKDHDAKGRFTAGNHGGPGRPKKRQKLHEVEESYEIIFIRMFEEPKPLAETAEIGERIEHGEATAYYRVFGYWLKKVAVTPDQVKPMISEFKRLKAENPDATMSEVYEKMYGKS